jgi:hypothetical protein
VALRRAAYVERVSTTGSEVVGGSNDNDDALSLVKMPVPTLV